MGNLETSIRKHKAVLQTRKSTTSYSKENNGQEHKLCM